MSGLAKSLGRDPQVDSILRNRRQELGIGQNMRRRESIAHKLQESITRGRQLTRPDMGCRDPALSLTRVDFPEPFAPAITTNSPSLTVNTAPAFIFNEWKRTGYHQFLVHQTLLLTQISRQLATLNTKETPNEKFLRTLNRSN